MTLAQPFVQAVLAGACDLDAIDDYVDAWHDSNGAVEFWTFLGMTHLEFARWVERAELLPLIVLAHRFALPLSDRDEIVRAARASGPLERTLLEDFLTTDARLRCSRAD
ncbi:MAG: hypothetical protein ACKVVT_05895 [Dehalococcoidia bacterium]